VEEDVRRIKMLFPHISIYKEIMPDVYLGDARDLSDMNFKKKPTIIITSPPYANRYDYTRTYSLLSLFFLTCSSIQGYVFAIPSRREYLARQFKE